MDVLAGITVALALIPEAIAFSLMAGVDPTVGLHASFCIAVVIAIFGGRPGMISAATGAMALIMVSLVAEHGLEYLLAATILTGIIQFVLGALRFGRFLSFIPHPVIVGFLNALGILIFTTQLTHFQGSSWIMYAMVAATIAIIYLLPRYTKAVPSALVAIVVMSVIAIAGGLELRTVEDVGAIATTLPIFHLPMIEWTLDTLWIILPYSLSLAVVGILESLLTATILDEMTDTKSDKNKEVRGQGIANTVTGLFGGMAGCAMIGQSLVNVKSGGRGRLSTLVSGVFLLFLILVMGDIVAQIPMGALVGVMITISIATFDVKSLKTLHKAPLTDTFVMLSTVAVVLYTHNLALGVLVGILLSAVIFGWRIARISAVSRIEADGTKHYAIRGQLFFGTMSHFGELFDPAGDPEQIVIDFGASHIWDHSAVTAITKVLGRYEQAGIRVRMTGLNEESRLLVERLT
ncbi:sodium-independent anion transporter [Paenibacillus sp. 598K]|uniref:SulP family inorganic anion transporter n=1 Tax=Paenibacillus sp. 598K TaxID=1117987 RepID=UPI000FFA5A8F|nr:SulP family inorganic anion transporter [Paenibacillus sp. 598K]GBF77717.1 sodium-independent anion transporter [Paenibacillus sp. 598K]